jgi:hypothetical protein
MVLVPGPVPVVLDIGSGTSKIGALIMEVFYGRPTAELWGCCWCCHCAPSTVHRTASRLHARQVHTSL